MSFNKVFLMGSIVGKEPIQSKSGVSDILGLYQGRFLAIEVKRPSISKKTGQFIYRTQEELVKKASPGQVSFVDQINKSGGCAFFADSLEVVKEQMILYFPSFQN